MELYEQILLKILGRQTEFSSVDSKKLKEIFDSECYRTLQKIQEILKDDTLDDSECFGKIEEIVCVFESMGSGCGTRHDF
ncbi:MAG: hypothetical protein IJ435_04110 [Clostridia bacterium]|nr:hypothetical protein [Clostridia bacterium]